MPTELNAKTLVIGRTIRDVVARKEGENFFIWMLNEKDCGNDGSAIALEDFCFFSL